MHQQIIEAPAAALRTGLVFPVLLTINLIAQLPEALPREVLEPAIEIDRGGPSVPKIGSASAYTMAAMRSRSSRSRIRKAGGNVSGSWLDGTSTPTTRLS